MRHFFLGFLTALVAFALLAFGYVRLGFVDPRADIPVNSLEKSIAMPSMDASVDRHAPKVENPVEPTDASLLAGMKIYQANCALCHGDVTHPHAALAGTLYPRPPQFLDDPPDMPEYQNFYIICHGLRLTGMPGWANSLSEQQMWQVTTFLSHMDKLPSQLSDQWKSESQPPAKP